MECLNKKRKLSDNINNELPANENNHLEKIKQPKRKYAIIHGYSGLNYSGNQM